MTGRGVELVDALELRGDEAVVDAGCGTGQVTARLLERLPAGRVVAVDGSRDMLRVAAERFAGDPRVELLHADLERPLPLAAPADGLVSTSTFHWIGDHDALWGHLAGALAPGAFLAAEFGGRGNCASILAVDGVEDLWDFAGPEDTLARLAAAGFADARAELVPRPAPIPAAQLPEYLRTVVLSGHVARLGPEAGEALVQRVCAALDEPVIDYVRLVVHARRG